LQLVSTKGVAVSRVRIFILAVFALALCVAGITHAAGGLSPKEARTLIAHFAGINLPSDAVRIKEISPMGSSAVVVAQVETAFRLSKEGDKWRVTEIRTGDNRWEDVDTLVKALNAEKSARAKAELETIAGGLGAFHRDRGFYVEGKGSSLLMDHLSPHYLTRVIRIDPWNLPYSYEGTRSGYSLRSNGPDGLAGTGDDIVLSK
jgi:hypothetical protein